MTRVLLDACVPVDFRHALAPFSVVTARFAGLQSLSNGALLAAMAERFDVLITVDRSLVRQQTMPGLQVAVVVMRSPTNTLPDLGPLAPGVRAAIARIAPGEVIEVS